MTATETKKDEKEEEPFDPLKRKGRLFYGLYKEILARWPWYYLDYRDAIDLQCLTAVIFMVFAALAPAITFGGLMGKRLETINRSPLYGRQK